MSADHRDSDYVLIPKLPPEQNSQWPKGQQCGECGMKFDFGTAYGFVCLHQRCPIMPKVTWGPA